MNNVLDMFTNYGLWCAAIGWCSAQVLKVVITLILKRKFDLRLLVASGGMPSSHSATVTALATATGKLCGFGSVQFALAFVFAFIVMYDASGVRRAAGEHAKLLNRLAKSIEHGDKMEMQKELKELIGHTPLEVMAGAMLGVIIGIMFKVA